MNVRGLCVAGIVIVAVLVAVPGAMAEHDGGNPVYGVPDPASVTAGAAATAEATAGEALTTYAANEAESMEAVETAAESAQNGNPEIPADNAEAVFDNTAAFIENGVYRAHSYGSLVQDWAFSAANQKLDEANQTGDRANESAAHHVTGARNLAQTTLSTVCRDTVVGSDCAEDSLVGQLVRNSNETVGQASGALTNQASNAQGAVDHATAEIQVLLCGGPCNS